MTDWHFDDFTESEYRRIIELARQKWTFVFYPDFSQPLQYKCLWRHDVDFSVHRAMSLAKIEAELGLQATYFLLLHSEFYNLLEREISQLVYSILDLGHKLGLHFDPSYYQELRSRPDFSHWLQIEKSILENTFSTSIEVFSWHNPDRHHLGEVLTQNEIAGMINTYGLQIAKEFTYISDSNGYWRFRRLPEVVLEEANSNLHVLTHPEWWTPTAMSPRARVSRCIDGRSSNQHLRYDEFLKMAGRINVR